MQDHTYPKPSVPESKNLLWWFIYLAISVGFTILYIRISEPESFRSYLVDFTANRPYQYRVLVPAIVHVFRPALPGSLQGIYGLTTCAATLIALNFFRKLLGSYCVHNPKIAALTLVYPMLWNYTILQHRFYPSDIPSIAFFIACFYYFRTRKRRRFYLMYFLALFNRETIIFLAIIPLIESISSHLDFKHRSDGLRQVAILIGLFLCVKLFLLFIFMDNQGAISELQWRYNVILLYRLLCLDHRMWAYLLFCFGGTHLMALYRFRTSTPDTKPLLWLVPIVVLTMFFTGILAEVRIYGELVPIFLVILLAPMNAATLPFSHFRLKISKLRGAIRDSRNRLRLTSI